MKRFVALILAVLMMSAITGCRSSTVEEQPEAKDGAERYSSLCVDIGVGESGYYGMWADTELVYENGELVSIYLENPTLLAFKVSERWADGIAVMSGEELYELLDMLESMRQTYKNEDVQARLLEIIEKLEGVAVLTDCPT